MASFSAFSKHWIQGRVSLARNDAGELYPLSVPTLITW